MRRTPTCRTGAGARSYGACPRTVSAMLDDEGPYGPFSFAALASRR